MSSPAEIAAGAAVEVVLIGVAAGVLYRVWGKFLPTPKRHTVPPFYTAVLMRGRTVERVLEPGAYWISSKRTLVLCDMRSKPFQVPAQELVTADGMGVRISLGGEYRVANPQAFITESSDAFSALYLELRHSLHVAVAELKSEAILRGEANLADRLRELVVPRATQLGTELTQIQVWEAVPIGWVRQD
jgi:regulator of protease activity HflC (stomatin/prohibitin superfamily)